MSKYIYSFLTSNAQKAVDFTNFGFAVKNFERDIKEIKSRHTDVISIYKAKDTGLSNIIVEDTGLFVKDAPFCGTEIKYLYEHIKNNQTYDGRAANWTVAICVKTENEFLVATGNTVGLLRYPAVSYGYHFESIFALNDGEKERRFCDLNLEEKIIFSPRYKALKKLVYALDNDDYSEMLRVSCNSLPEWEGKYQSEEISPITKEIILRSDKFHM